MWARGEAEKLWVEATAVILIRAENQPRRRHPDASVSERRTNHGGVILMRAQRAEDNHGVILMRAQRAEDLLLWHAFTTEKQKQSTA
jgi:hypothetical protein